MTQQTNLETVLQQARHEYPNPIFYSEEVATFANIIMSEKVGCIEMRAIGDKTALDLDDQQTLVGFYDNIDALVRDCRIHHNKQHLYIGLNLRNSSLLQGCTTNQLSSGGGGKATDISHRQLIPFDIDITRESGTSATDEEIKNGCAVFEAVKNDLSLNGIKPILCGFSGNGLHILVKTILYSNNDGLNKGIGLLLRYFNRKYGNNHVKVDSTTHDIGRIWKIYGTASIKGTNSTERPRRTARILELNENVEPCDIVKIYKSEILEQIEFENPNKNYNFQDTLECESFSKSQSQSDVWTKYKGNIRSFDIVAFCKEKGIYRRHIFGNKHAIKCPFFDEHTTGFEGDSSTVIFEANEDGWPGFNCKHDHCNLRRLEDFLSVWSTEDIDRFCKKTINLKSNIDSSSVIQILPLVRTREKSIKYPAHELGEILGTAAEVIQEVMQAPLAICSQSLLACAAFLAQSHVKLLIDGRVSPASLFFLTIGESGDRKSAVDKIALEHIVLFERKAMEKYRQERIKYEEEIRSFRKSRHNENSNSDKTPQPPICPLMLVQEPTYEGVFKHFASGQHTLGLCADEGGRMFGGYAMHKDNILKTVAGFSELWDGSPISRMRGSEDVEKLYDKRLSMHLLVQPVVAKTIFSDPIMRGQGFLARILSWHPETLAGTRLYKRINVYCTPAVEVFNNRVDEILALLPPLQADKLNQFTPRDVKLSDKAHDIFQEFHDEVESQISPYGKFTNIQPFASKAAELAARIALVLNFFHEPNIKKVSDSWMRRGCTIVSSYLQETHRLWGDTPIDANIALSEKTRIWLYKHKFNLISGKELYQKGPSEIRTLENASKIVRILIDHGYLRPSLANGSQKFASQIWEVVNEDFHNS